MIPQIIHYIWFGKKPLAPLAEECLASWHEHMPNWQIMRWDEATLTQTLNQPNLNLSIEGRTSKQPKNQSQDSHSWLDYMPLYVKQAYEARKYAFVSDYVRLWALEQYGGVYVDTDVKVLKSYEPLLNDTAFSGLEESKTHLPGTCVMGCEPHCKWVKDMLALYDGIEFVKADGSLDMTTNVDRMGLVMMKEGLNQIDKSEELRVKSVKPWKHNQYIEKWGLRVYTHDYFCPITSTRVMRKTKNTYSIHYFAGSWVEKTRGQMVKDWVIEHIVGRKLTDKIVQLKRKLRKK